ncbi:MAG TPA: hypothetical protein VM123_12240 [archaeon]|nr:hypothetical protein [archaeon]
MVESETGRSSSQLELALAYRLARRRGLVRSENHSVGLESASQVVVALDPLVQSLGEIGELLAVRMVRYIPH